MLVGTVAREHSGPALPLSFLVAGFAAALSALCYAELASRCPSAGSAYHYSYICVGEGYSLSHLISGFVFLFISSDLPIHSLRTILENSPCSLAEK